MKSSTRVKDTDWVDFSLKGPQSCYQIAAYWIAPPTWPRRVFCEFFPNVCNAFRSTKACCSIVAALVITYFIIMDILLYSYFREVNLVHASKKGRPDELFSPFTHLSVKALISDEPSQFLKTPSAEYFNSITHFSSVFPFITANVISIAHLICAFLAGKFIASSILNDRRIGVALFCFRTWLDALDGVVFRAQSNKRLEFRSHPSTTGYFIDASFDTLGGFFLCFGILFHLIKRFGPKKYHLLPMWKGSTNSSASAALLVENSACGSSGTKEAAPEPGDGGGEEIYSVSFLFSKALTLGVCLGLAGMGWNYTMQSLTDTFQTELKDENLSILQYQYCHSFTTVLIFMGWRLLGSMAILNYIMLAVFFDCIWEFLKGPHVILLCLNLTLFAASEIYIRHLRSALQL